MSGPAGVRADRDPGLQPERTRLAWRRTTLTYTVASVLAVRTALHGGVPAVGTALCALCCACWLGFLLVAHRRIRTIATSAPAGPVPRHLSAAVLCVTALAGCGAALVLLSR